MSVDDRTRAILADAVVDGSALRLVGQLDRTEYTRVNKVLEALGGRWNRKAGVHLFAGDPSDALAAILGGANAPRSVRATEGFVATPCGLADDLAETYARIADLPAGAAVLEPSAGDGALVRGIRRVRARRTSTTVQVWAVEPHAERLARVGDADGRDVLVNDTFENFAATTAQRFDAVVMNPPFAVPGQPTIWIDHVRLAWALLKPGGRLAAIVPAGFADRQDRRHVAIRELVAEHGGSTALPDNAFTSQGTGVRTMVLWLDRPPAVTEAAA